MARRVKPIRTHNGKLDYGGWKRLRKITERRILTRLWAERKDYDGVRWHLMQTKEIEDYAHGTAYCVLFMQCRVSEAMAERGVTTLFVLGAQQYGARELCLFMFWEQHASDEFMHGVGHAYAVSGAIEFGRLEALKLYCEESKRCYGNVEPKSREWLEASASLRKPKEPDKLRNLQLK